MPRVLVTGASGFVGSTLCTWLSEAGYVVRAALRTERALPIRANEKVVVGNIGSTTSWRDALSGVDFVIHAAAVAHILNAGAARGDLYAETNARGTQRLAQAAALAGVRRFVYLSSVKVNGEETTGRPFAAGDEPSPQDDYGRSKWLGEQYLTEIATQGGMERAIVRSPLVYGPGVRANFLRLLQWVYKRRPLPFGAVANRRSLVSVWTLCDLLTILLEHPAASADTWMVSDDEDLSTPELVRRMAKAMKRPALLLPVPTPLLRLCGRLAGRSAEVDRLCGSLALDVTQTRRQLGWRPPVSLDVALSKTVEWYRATLENRTGGM